MITLELASRVADAFNRHGKFTAQAERNRIEIRHVDTGEYATALWVPAYDGDYFEWFARVAWREAAVSRKLPYLTTVEAVVRAVATSVLDERPKP